MQKKFTFEPTPTNYQKLKPYQKNYTFKMNLKKNKNNAPKTWDIIKSTLTITPNR